MPKEEKTALRQLSGKDPISLTEDQKFLLEILKKKAESRKTL